MFAYFAALNVLDARVLFSKQTVADLMDPATHAPKAALERHHLFPKSHLKSELRIMENKDINQIANFTRVRGPNRLRRQDLQSVVSVTANTDRRHSGMARGLIEKSMSKFPMPPGYSWSFAQSRWYRQEDSDTSFGLLLAAGLVYMIMASLFESFIHPFVIMFSIPFAFFGVAFGFHFTGTAVDHMSIIGIMLLFISAVVYELFPER